METYIALLRGINLGNHKKIAMNDLKTLFGKLGYSNSRTYLQSGNVVFGCAPMDSQTLARQIEEKIRAALGFDVPIVIRSSEEVKAILEHNPLLNEPGVQGNPDRIDKLHVTFLAEAPAQAQIDKLSSLSYEPDRFVLLGREVFIECPNGYGRTKLTNTFFESKLKITATTRNWKTVNELLKLAES